MCPGLTKRATIGQSDQPFRVPAFARAVCVCVCVLCFAEDGLLRSGIQSQRVGMFPLGDSALPVGFFGQGGPPWRHETDFET